jgi:ankyrin repeat protein
MVTLRHFHRALAALPLLLGGLLASQPAAGRADEQGWSAAHRAAETGDLETLRALDAAGVDLDAPHPESGERPQHRAARRQKFEALRHLVQSGEIEVGVGDNHGASVLYWAARSRDLELTRWLIDQGAPVVVQRGWHPLLGAAIGGSVELVRFYLELGIPRDLPDQDHNDAVSLAAMFGQTEVVVFLLGPEPRPFALSRALRLATLGRGGPENAVSLSRHLLPRLQAAAPPEHFAEALREAFASAYANHAPDAVHAVLQEHATEAGLDRGPLHGQVLHRLLGEKISLAVLDKALSAGADPNHRDQDGNTPLSAAAVSQDPSIILRLVEAGADPSLRNRRGLSPLDRARTADGNSAVSNERIRILSEFETRAETAR